MKGLISLTAFGLVMGLVPALAALHTADAAWRVARCGERSEGAFDR